MAIRTPLHEVTLNGKKLDPTLFERDLVRAINGETGYSRFQSRGAEKVAHLAAAKLKTLNVTGHAELVSGGGKSNLTPLYQEYGVTSGKSKTDIKIGAYQCSMKYAKQFQIASAQSNEAQAVFAAAFQNTPEYTQLVQRYILPLLNQAMNKQTFYKLRAQWDKKDPAAFQNHMSKVLGLHSAHGKPTQAQITEFATFMGELGVEIPVRGKLYEFLQATKTKQTLFYEFATGSRRFIESAKTSIATHMLAWDEEGNVHIETAKQFIQRHAGDFNYSFRDRGSKSGANPRGAALRIGGSGPAFDLSESVDEITMHNAWTVLTETLHREAAVMLLDEGFVGDLWNKAKEVLDMIIAAVKAAIAFILNLIRRGATAVMEAFGYEVTGMTWTWSAS